MRLEEPASLVADRLLVPEGTRAVLWDMDGVLIDSLGLDLTICNALLARYVEEGIEVDADFVRSIFAYDPVEFWHRIGRCVVERYGREIAPESLDQIIRDYEEARHQAAFSVLPGIRQILGSFGACGCKLAVVSNNPTDAVRTTLERIDLLTNFDVVVGNDLRALEKKPAPDPYLFAAEQLEVDPADCVVIEDSLLGVAAGVAAGCHTVAVATGGTRFEELAQSPAHQVYTRFDVTHLHLAFGDVRKKTIQSPNEFVSHMVEHIAWRLCACIDLHWHNTHWWQLGRQLGRFLAALPRQQESAAALGMIDDGSAEVAVRLPPQPTNDDAERPGTLQLRGTDQLDIDWFLGLRCEQIDSGEPLVRLLRGVAHGLGGEIDISVVSVEDPHHAWEGVFRSLGIALSRIFTPAAELGEAAVAIESTAAESPLSTSAKGSIRVLECGLDRCVVRRETAESHVQVAVDLAGRGTNHFQFKTANSISLAGFDQLLERMARAGGFTLEVDFAATVLSSSHVALEDTALVLGRALLEILMLRMEAVGANGAGSNIHTIEAQEQAPVGVGLSVEGRKFWSFVPFQQDFTTLRRDFLIGHDLGGLRSEDLDDFIDGLAGGLTASIMIHMRRPVAASEGWPLVFDGLGMALRETFAANAYRQGVPPGVKATLA